MRYLLDKIKTAKTNRLLKSTLANQRTGINMIKQGFFIRTFTLVTFTGLAWLLLFDQLNQETIIQTTLFSLFLSFALSLIKSNQEK
jgi:hypothetical protein